MRKLVFVFVIGLAAPAEADVTVGLAPCLNVPHARMAPVKAASTFGSTDSHLLLPLHLVLLVPADFTANQHDKLSKLGHAIVKSEWLKAAAKDYVSGGDVKAKVTVLDTSKFTFPSQPTATSAEKYIAAEIKGKSSVQHEGHNLYAIVVPPGLRVLDPSGNGTHPGYHQSFHTIPVSESKGDGWAVIQPEASFDIDRYSVILSHETIEAVTDTGGHGFIFRPDKTQPILTILPRELAGEGEVGDICGGARIVEGDFVYQRTFSNSRAAVGGDFCAPAPTSTYFNTSPVVVGTGPLGTLAFASWTEAKNGAATITIVGWGGAPGDCKVKWNIEASAVDREQDGAFTPIIKASALSTTTLSAGARASLKVKVPSTAKPGTFGLVMVTSTPIGTPARGQDSRHEWVFGVYVPKVPKTASDEPHKTVPEQPKPGPPSAHM